MDNFFNKCGQFIRHSVSVTGRAPTRTYISRFQYTNGYADYDGHSWSFQLHTELGE